MRPRGRGTRPAAVGVALSLVLVGCAITTGPSRTSSPTSTPAGAVTAAFEILPPPGPVKPFRGEMEGEVQVVDGYASMLIRLRNIGEDPITFLNTLYDYEPRQLYEPMVRIEWADGTGALSTRFGRFFPAPAIIQPGDEAVYLLAGAPVTGSGEIGDVVTHIKFCPTRGMDDAPANPLEVRDVTWTAADGLTTVRGTIAETVGQGRAGRPTIGVALFDTDGVFIGGVVATEVGERLAANASRAFEISGPGVPAERIATAQGWAWVR